MRAHWQIQFIKKEFGNRDLLKAIIKDTSNREIIEKMCTVDKHTISGFSESGVLQQGDFIKSPLLFINHVFTLDINGSIIVLLRRRLYNKHFFLQLETIGLTIPCLCFLQY